MNGKKDFDQYKESSKKYINNKDQGKQLLSRAQNKLNNINKSFHTLRKLSLLFYAFSDYLKGRYNFSSATITMIVVAILYFVIPTDLVPDFIPLGGYVDDASVIAYVIGQIHNDLQNYKNWKEDKIDKR